MPGRGIAYAVSVTRCYAVSVTRCDPGGRIPGWPGDSAATSALKRSWAARPLRSRLRSALLSTILNLSGTPGRASAGFPLAHLAPPWPTWTPTLTSTSAPTLDLTDATMKPLLTARWRAGALSTSVTLVRAATIGADGAEKANVEPLRFLASTSSFSRCRRSLIVVLYVLRVARAIATQRAPRALQRSQRAVKVTLCAAPYAEAGSFDQTPALATSVCPTLVVPVTLGRTLSFGRAQYAGRAPADGQTFTVAVAADVALSEPTYSSEIK